MLTNQMVLSMQAQKTTDILDERFYFEVPNNIKGIRLRVSKTIDHYFTMGVFDSKGRLRGQFLHGGKDELTIHEDPKLSTPYTVSGEIPNGKWYCAVVGEGDRQDATQEWGQIHITLNPKISEKFDDNIWVNVESYPYLSAFNDTEVLNEESNWYRGDLHTHTIYSDGEMTREELVQAAKNEKLDFIVNTDHSILTTSWPKDNKLLVIPGVEISFYHGHSNILNPNQLAYQNGDINVIASHEGAVKALNQDYGPHSIIMINHPVLDEFAWQYGNIPLANISAIEIINSPSFHLNDMANNWALLLWDFLLNDGHKMTGVGGSDVHSAPENEMGEKVGDPSTYIYSHNLSARSLMEGIKNRRVIVSRDGFIEMTFKDYFPGDTITENSGTVHASVQTTKEVYIEWIVDGQVVHSEDGVESSYTFLFDEKYHWLRVNIRNKENNTLIGFTNPYFYGEKSVTCTHWQSVIDDLREKIPETRELFHEG